eukprot:1143491-Pelagomonas_calceolata.AAC.1
MGQAAPTLPQAKASFYHGSQCQKRQGTLHLSAYNVTHALLVLEEAGYLSFASTAAPPVNAGLLSPVLGPSAVAACKEFADVCEVNYQQVSVP